MYAVQVAFLSGFPRNPFGYEFSLHMAPIVKGAGNGLLLDHLESLPERSDKLKSISEI